MSGGSPPAAGLAAGAADPCVHCGFCLPTCASYRVLGTEMDSPRGRIHMLKAIEAGELSLDATVASHFDSCLGCFACVSACPSGVRYDQLIEEARPRLNAAELRSPWQQSLRRLLLALLPYPQRLRALLQPMRLYSGSGLQRLVRGRGLMRLFGPELTALEALLPPLAAEGFQDSWPVVAPAEGPRRHRVGLVLGCVQRSFDPAVNRAVLAVLNANGIEVVIPPQQGCCGAVSHHQGAMEQTRSLAGDLVAAFDAVLGPGRPAGPEPLDAVLVAASGCGHTLKSYDRLIGRSFAAPVADVHEFLDRVGLSAAFRQRLRPLAAPDGAPATAEAPRAVAYHDACHMIHGQGLQAEPRRLLSAIPHLQLREAVEAGVCCGSAGIYNLVQPREAEELGRLKAADLRGTGAELIASANIGCTLQLRRHLEPSEGAMVRHPMELLALSAGLLPA
ncbi:(Fe-S)-binding protein [Synechococcus sp. RSCCF101]|uniref:(Fe-S)-binding protein n=1 Tax=Synechococcus sp. RSCCF101 TaxID=2511069 RepID=UPI0012458940|nr:(Fe-S)-binding protein [Synechococcus sp. RSCCF101]QEY32447.1 (Fe-S)-binding protein [Synechococcus sp. RSCCF101]